MRKCARAFASLSRERRPIRRRRKRRAHAIVAPHQPLSNARLLAAHRSIVSLLWLARSKPRAIDRRQGAAQAARHEGRAQISARNRWRQEGEETFNARKNSARIRFLAASLSPGHRRAPRNPPLPKIDRASDPQTAISAPRSRDRSGLQNGSSIPKSGGFRPSRGC